MCGWLIWATGSVHHIAVAKKNRRIISERLPFSNFLKIFNAVQSLSKLHKMTFTTAHFHVTTAQFVINCTLKYALHLSLAKKLRGSVGGPLLVDAWGPGPVGPHSPRPWSSSSCIVCNSIGVHSAKRRHQSPEWTILSNVNYFIQREVVRFQVLLSWMDSLKLST